MHDDAARTTSPWLHAYAVCVALSILVLICIGGVVTSKGAGLAVPDWPTSYGYNMFAFPVSRWVGGVFFEHVHRLAASVVGLLTLGLTGWIIAADRRRWMKVLGVLATVAVIVQGLLGGLRVVELWAWMGIFHACLAQVFLAVVSFIALATSRWWFALGAESSSRMETKTLGKILLILAHLIFLQLALGATMRHAHAGLSIPDFPTAYGHWWPQIHKADLPALNIARDAVGQPPTTLGQIHLQMTHRTNAYLVLALTVFAAALAWRGRTRLPGALCGLAMAGVGFVAVQMTLGIYVIWTNKAADVATAHVAVGAASFVWAVLAYAAWRRWTSMAMEQTARAVYAPLAHAAA